LRKITDFEGLTCSGDTTISDVIKRIDNSTPLLFQLILDDARRVVGTVTDGDIRRGFARGLQLDSPVKGCMHFPPVIGGIADGLLNRERLVGRRFLPVCDADGTLNHILAEIDTPSRAERALIVAGGFGTRLGEMTKSIPKPLIHVGGKPMLEHILERLENYGIKRVDISVHFLADQIENFINQRDNRCEITIVHENEPLGTAGSLGLINQPLSEPILLLNADVLTDVDLNSLVEHHARLECDGSIAATRYEHQVPYGVLRFDDSDTLLGIEEKPTYYHLVSAGIYYLNPSIVRLVAPGERIDIPELFELAVKNGMRLTVFPVHEYWSDVGHPTDLEIADLFHKERSNGK